jgi:hypothetical protein
MIMENEKLNTLELLIHSKQWDELTAQEKDLVIEELGSEEQFLAMKSLDASLKTSINTSHLPNENILPLLKQRMRMKHKTELAFHDIFNFKIPGLAFIIFVCLFSFAGWWVGKNSSFVKITEAPLIKMDTVYLTSTPDTVVVDRIVYRYIQKNRSYQKQILSVANTGTQVEVQNIGINMKEKEELDNLLVSGSDK